MRLRSRLKWFVTFAVLAYAASPAGAQTQQSPPPAPIDARVGFQARVNVSPEQEVAEAAGVITYINQASQIVGRRLAQARQQKDVVKTLCLNDKLSQIDVAAKTAAERLQALKAAAARNDLEGSSHQFIILTVLKQRNDQLVAEANQCIGQENAFLGATNIVTTVDPTLPLTPVTDMPPDLTPVSVIPVSGSSGL